MIIVTDIETDIGEEEGKKMMRGHLKTIILSLLKEKPMSGSELIKELEQKMNWKPSCGSLYPLLKTLEHEKYAISKSEEGKKTYTITTKAKTHLKKEDKQKQELIKNMEKTHKLLEEIYGCDLTMETEILQSMKQGQMPFQEILDESNMIKEEITKLQKNNKLRTNITEIKKILKKTASELKKINKEK